MSKPNEDENPCLYCTDERAIGCHGTCYRYKKFQERNEAKKQARIAFLKAHPETKTFAKKFGR